MKTLNAKNLSKAGKQAGFTIIELVVVILLLGILTATALPRFLDLTDEAHQAVVDATEGGLGTAAALFRAQWVGLGEPATAITEFGGNFAHTTSGYPIGTAASGAAFANVADCVNMVGGIMQTVGAVSVVAASGASAAAAGTTVGSTGAANLTVDFVVVHPTDNTDACELWYTAETNGALVATKYITYDAGAGTVVEASATPAS